MDRSEFLPITEKEEIFEYLPGRHVQDSGHDLHYANVDVDVENVSYAIKKISIRLCPSDS